MTLQCLILLVRKRVRAFINYIGDEVGAYNLQKDIEKRIVQLLIPVLSVLLNGNP